MGLFTVASSAGDHRPFTVVTHRGLAVNALSEACILIFVAAATRLGHFAEGLRGGRLASIRMRLDDVKTSGIAAMAFMAPHAALKMYVVCQTIQWNESTDLSPVQNSGVP